MNENITLSYINDKFEIKYKLHNINEKKLLYDINNKFVRCFLIEPTINNNIISFTIKKPHLNNIISYLDKVF